jgi:hypothetical protein
VSKQTFTINDVKQHLTADECAALDEAIETAGTQEAEDYACESLDAWLADFFVWSDTSQGHDYWSAIYDRLMEAGIAQAAVKHE